MTTTPLSSTLPATHWLPGVERRGLGDLVLCVNHIALIVSDVGRSTAFYTDVLGLQQIQRPNFDRHGAWLTAGNLEIHLIKGIPLVHTGENLIVSHIAMDVKDPEEAFRRLRKMKVPFEVNVSVPKGQGKAESEGGGRDNTLSQAFIRDPDGYYLEICNCNVLTEFALGASTGALFSDDVENDITNVVDDNSSTATTTTTSASDESVSEDDSKKGEIKKQVKPRRRGPVSLFCITKLLVLASRAKKRYKKRKLAAMWGRTRNIRQISGGDDEQHHTGKDEEVENIKNKECCSLEVDKTILANMISRMQVYGDICQSFEDYELEEFLRKAKNSAPMAILLMLEEIHNGRKRLFQPPAYYVECNTNKRHQNENTAITAPVEEKSFRPAKMEAPRTSSFRIMTAGLKSVLGEKRFSFWGNQSSKSILSNDDELSSGFLSGGQQESNKFLGGNNGSSRRSSCSSSTRQQNRRRSSILSVPENEILDDTYKQMDFTSNGSTGDSEVEQSVGNLSKTQDTGTTGHKKKNRSIKITKLFGKNIRWATTKRNQ